MAVLFSYNNSLTQANAYESVTPIHTHTPIKTKNSRDQKGFKNESLSFSWLFLCVGFKAQKFIH